MSETNAVITFRVDADLKRRFSKRAHDLDRKGAQVLRDLMRGFVGEPSAAHDAWFRGQVLEAQMDSRDPLPSEDVERRFAARRAAARGGKQPRKSRSR